MTVLKRLLIAPQILFDTLIRESLDEPRKSILKRDAHSFDEGRQSLLPNPDRGLLDRKAKSFEEREEDYEKVRRRIFKGRELVGFHRGGLDMHQQHDDSSWPWSSTESADNASKTKGQNNRLLKVHSLVRRHLKPERSARSSLNLSLPLSPRSPWTRGTTVRPCRRATASEATAARVEAAAAAITDTI